MFYTCNRSHGLCAGFTVVDGQIFSVKFKILESKSSFLLPHKGGGKALGGGGGRRSVRGYGRTPLRRIERPCLMMYLRIYQSIGGDGVVCKFLAMSPGSCYV